MASPLFVFRINFLFQIEIAIGIGIEIEKRWQILCRKSIPIAISISMPVHKKGAAEDQPPLLNCRNTLSVSGYFRSAHSM